MASKFNSRTAIAVVVANMIGTGVFTSLGFQLVDIQSVFVLLMLWVVGGITALCGALTYAELGSALPRSGGEYNFLTQLIHPGAGFISGWISATIGFAAPTALAAITFGKYLQAVVPEVPTKLSASVLVIALTLAHVWSRSASGGTQRIFTLVKVVLILFFCVACWFWVAEPQPISVLPQAGDGALFTSSAFAVSLIYVSYAYTGWNAATYLTSELENPIKTLPKVLALGTFVVMLMYLLLNFTFLYVAPMANMVNRVEIGYVASEAVFGPVGGAAMGLMLAVLLISTASAMILAGPRVLQVIGEDFRVFRALAKTNDDVYPVAAIVFLSVITLTFIATSSFDYILKFAGFTLGLNTFFTVAGVFVLRRRQPSSELPFRMPLFPIPPLVYLALTGWTLVHLLGQPVEPGKIGEGWMGLILVAIGGVVYLLSKALSDKIK
ncbi:MAG: amino acid permease [Pseudomonadota bacterium]